MSFSDKHSPTIKLHPGYEFTNKYEISISMEEASIIKMFGYEWLQNNIEFMHYKEVLKKFVLREDEEREFYDLMTKLAREDILKVQGMFGDEAFWGLGRKGIMLFAKLH